MMVFARKWRTLRHQFPGGHYLHPVAVAAIRDASATLRVKFLTFRNPNSRDYYNRACDLIFRPRCDNVFTICLDTNRNNGNFGAGDCTYGVHRTGEFANRDDITFDQDMFGVANPIIVHMDHWQSVRLKMSVYDDDSSHSSHDLVDYFFRTWSTVPGVNGTHNPTISTLVIQGTRTQTQKTSLTVQFSAWCDSDYYGADCRTYCRYQDDALGHFGCTSRGQKVCLNGWEDLRSGCTVRADDCEGHTCQNGARCEDGDRTYVCRCKPGFTDMPCFPNQPSGGKCQLDIDECSSMPCKNNGTCVDTVSGFSCQCPSSHPAELSPVCAVHTCLHTDPCINGGTCYGNGLCHCPPNFTGTKCQLHYCEQNCITCENGGVCVSDSCRCPLGTLGMRCEVRVCDVITCVNGGTCISNGTCVCPTGYGGRYCHEDLDDCASSPCANHAQCIDHVASFSCICPPGFAGALCQLKTISVKRRLLNKNMVMTTLPMVQRNVFAFQTGKPVVAAVTKSVSNPMVMVLILLVVALLVVIVLLVACLCLERIKRKRKSVRMTATSGGGSGCEEANFENPVYTMELPQQARSNTIYEEPEYSLPLDGATGGPGPGSGPTLTSHSDVTKAYLAGIAESEYARPPRGPARPAMHRGAAEPVYHCPRPRSGDEGDVQPPPYSPPGGASGTVPQPGSVSMSDIKARLEAENAYEELSDKMPLP